jgi:hypothetical protein
MQWPARTTSVERWPQILPPLIGDQPVSSSPNQKGSSSKSAYQVDPVQCTPKIDASIVLHDKRKTEILLPRSTYVRAMTTLAHLIE